MSINTIIRGLSQFHNSYFCSHLELFERLSQSQHPEVLFITCSDSRIDPNLLTQTEPGQLFILRNVGNIIPPYGTMISGEGAAIEYAVHALGVKDIIICGHSHCGAMKGLLQLGSLTENMPLVYDWLKKYAQTTRRLVQDNYKDYKDDELLKITIEENILVQIQNLETYPIVHSKLHAGQLYLHAWIYEIETGTVHAYNATKSSFVPIEGSFPIPNPLASMQPRQ